MDPQNIVSATPISAPPQPKGSGAWRSYLVAAGVTVLIIGLGVQMLKPGESVRPVSQKQFRMFVEDLNSSEPQKFYKEITVSSAPIATITVDHGYLKAAPEYQEYQATLLIEKWKECGGTLLVLKDWTGKRIARLD